MTQLAVPPRGKSKEQNSVHNMQHVRVLPDLRGNTRSAENHIFRER